MNNENIGKTIKNLKMSDIIGKHKYKFKEVYGEPPMVHGAFIYQCEDCGAKWLMWLEVGVEGKKKVMNSPFTIGCRCGGWAEHVDWDKDIKLRKPMPLQTGMKYFALDYEHGCGRLSIYLGKKEGNENG